MPDPAHPGGATPDRPATDPALRARARIERFSASVLRRLNLAGLLLVAVGVCTADFLAAGHVLWSAALTALQVVVAVPWAWTVLRMDRAEARILDSKRFGRVRRVLGHAFTFALLAAVLLTKAFVLHQAWQEGFEGLVPVYRQYDFVVLLLLVVGLVGRGSRMARFLGSVADHPARLMAISFAVVAMTGGFLLTMPWCVRDLRDANLVDGLFTATSAVCVTGLSVHDIASTYTFAGQVVLFTLMQAGGLGIMVLTASVAILAGRKLQTRSTAALAEMIDSESFAALRRTIRQIFLFTVAFEALGAVLLFLSLGPPPGALVADGAQAGPWSAEGVWNAAFHSVAAFCNAGFSLYPDNFLSFQGSFRVCGVVAGLITVGGLGFPVLHELWGRVRQHGRGPTRRLSLHTRIVLVTSAVLLGAGTVAFLCLEWGGTLAGLPLGEKVLVAAFQSVTTRTAGFNTVPFQEVAAPTLLVVCFLMFVGASPGSTGGGIKTTTFAALLVAFRAEMRGSAAPRIGDRKVADVTARRAAAVAVGSAVVVSLAWFALLLTERHGPLDVLFEAVSAFATCGLSTGVTPRLSDPGKLVVTFLMFVGRIGPMTLALAVAARPRVEHYSVPEERILIG